METKTAQMLLKEAPAEQDRKNEKNHVPGGYFWLHCCSKVRKKCIRKFIEKQSRKYMENDASRLPKWIRNLC